MFACAVAVRAPGAARLRPASGPRSARRSRRRPTTSSACFRARLGIGELGDQQCLAIWRPSRTQHVRRDRLGPDESETRSVGIGDPDLAPEVFLAHEGELLAVWRPARVVLLVGVLIEPERVQLGQRSIHADVGDVDLPALEAAQLTGAHEAKVLAVWRPRHALEVDVTVCFDVEPTKVLPVGIDDVCRRRVRVEVMAAEDDLAAVGPPRRVIGRHAGGELMEPRAIRIDDSGRQPLGVRRRVTHEEGTSIG